MPKTIWKTRKSGTAISIIYKKVAITDAVHRYL